MLEGKAYCPQGPTMEDRLTKQEIVRAIDGLAAALGVKEGPALAEYQAMLGSGRVEGCVVAIAQQLGLPITVKLSYVGAGSEGTFQTAALGKTDSRGRGIEGITAQVSIPPRLPLYGSSALSGFPIDVRVSNMPARFPATFVTMMAHELSHILLYSLRHPQKEDEWFTDLTAMVLGFSGIMRDGRRVTEESHDRTVTTTYGYFTDGEFAFALAQIDGLRARYAKINANLWSQLAETQRRCRETEHLLRRFRLFMEYHDAHTQRRIGPTAAKTIVACHNPLYLERITQALAGCKEVAGTAQNTPKRTVHYTKAGVGVYETLARDLQGKTHTLLEEMRLLEADVCVLRRHADLSFRLRLAVKETLLPHN
jgi:hypothetical protein